jgi:hypothetical protein
LKFKSKTPRNIARRPKSQEKLKKVIWKKEKLQCQQKHEKRQTMQNDKEELEKTQNQNKTSKKSSNSKTPLTNSMQALPLI